MDMNEALETVKEMRAMMNKIAFANHISIAEMTEMRRALRKRLGGYPDPQFKEGDIVKMTESHPKDPDNPRIEYAQITGAKGPESYKAKAWNSDTQSWDNEAALPVEGARYGLDVWKLSKPTEQELEDVGIK